MADPEQVQQTAAVTSVCMEDCRDGGVLTSLNSACGLSELSPCNDLLPSMASLILVGWTDTRGLLWLGKREPTSSPKQVSLQ